MKPLALFLSLCALTAIAAPTTQSIDVKPMERYVVSFAADLQGPDCIEEHPWYEVLRQEGAYFRKYGRGVPVAYWEVTFQTADGKTIGAMPCVFRSFSCILNRGKRTYREEFRVPPAAAKATLTVHPPEMKGNTLAVTDIAFTKVAEDKTLNVNADFEMGAHNLSGWNNGNNRDVVPDLLNPGKFMLVAGDKRAGGGVRSDWVPVKPGMKVRMEYSLSAAPGTFGGRLVIMTYKDTAQRDDCQSGSLTKGFFLFGTKPQPGTYDIVVPEGVNVLRVYAANACIRYFRFSEVADGGK